jgi:hypothetical protein
MRKTDPQEKTHFRSEDRIFRGNDRWWFATREGDQGPHDSRREAQYWLEQHIVGVRGDINLSDASPLDKGDSKTPSVWDDRPDTRR